MITEPEVIGHIDLPEQKRRRAIMLCDSCFLPVNTSFGPAISRIVSIDANGNKNNLDVCWDCYNLILNNI